MDERGRRVLLVCVLHDVSANADHGHPLLGFPVLDETEVLSDRRIAGPVPGRKGAGYHHGLLAGVAVGLRKTAALQNRQADGRKIIGRLHNHRGAGRLLGVRVGPALNFYFPLRGPQTGKAGGGGHIGHARQGPELGQEFFVELPAGLGFFVALVPALGQLDAGGENVLRTHKGVERLRGEEAADHQARAGEEHDGQRELKNDERAGQPAAVAAAAGRTVLHRGVEVHARGAQGGHEAEEDAAQDRQRGEVAEGHPVHLEEDPVGFAYIADRKVEGVDPEGRQPEAEQPAERAEQHALDEELADDLPAPMAARTAISRVRAMARLSIMLATLAQAMSSTKPTAPSIMRKTVWIWSPL